MEKQQPAEKPETVTVSPSAAEQHQQIHDISTSTVTRVPETVYGGDEQELEEEELW